MPIFKTQKEAHRAHENYHIDTDEEGKYILDGPSRSSGILRVKWLLENTPEEAFALEVGCNSGGLCRLMMKERRAYVKGVDICGEMVKRAVSKGVNALEAKAEDLPFEKETFELVIMTEVMEHLFDPKIVLAEIARVLQKGGIFLGSVPHPKGHNTTKRPLDEHDYHCHVFDHTEIKGLLSAHFTDIVLVDIPFVQDLERNGQWICWKAVK